MSNLSNTKIRFLISFVIFFTALSHNIFGQNISKGKWSPPDKSFTLSLPINLKDIKLYEGGNKNSSEYKKIKTYGGSISNHTFLVLILDYGEAIKKQEIQERFGGLEFVIGGDDDYKFEEKYLKFNGLNAREIIYLNQNKKGLMIDTGNKIIVLGLIVKKREYLNSAIAKKFLTSFRLL